jgi:predicted lipid-binding transport protein (Tim44 family)
MRARLAPGLLALSLALSACSGGGEEEGSPTLEPLETTASPSATAEAVPSAAAAATPEGAAEFVRYFYGQLEAAYAERDPERIAALVAPGCASCARYVRSVTELRDEDAQVRDYRLDVVDVAAPPSDGTDRTSVTAIVNLGEFVWYDAQGREETRTPAAPRTVHDIALIRSADTWLVQEVTAK